MDPYFIQMSNFILQSAKKKNQQIRANESVKKASVQNGKNRIQ